MTHELETDSRKDTVKMYFVPVAFLLGSLLGFIAGHVR